jgi:MFS family permease
MARRLGLRANLAQFGLLVVVNALVGGMVGQEQTVLPLLAEREFSLTGYTALLSYVLVFGLSKAATNYVAGAWSDRFGRRPVLVAGWLVALPVPLLLIWAPTWGWVVAANALLGVHQGLAWSTAVIMKIDLVGPRRRGLAMGLNEAAGYGAVAVSALLAGYLAARYGLRPVPFLVGLAYAALGLGLSALAVRETRDHLRSEAASPAGRPDHPNARLTGRQVLALTSLREPALASASQAGLVNNLTFGLSWGLFPLLFATAALTTDQIGLLFALYPAVWGVGQLLTGAASDRWGRRRLIIAGMFTQAAALAVIALAGDVPLWAVGAALLGAGTAMVYPTLLAVVGDVAHPRWRGRAVGVYRLWRDSGYAVGALLGGIVADLWGLRAAVWAAAVVTAVSGVLVAARLYETHHRGDAAPVVPRPAPATPAPGPSVLRRRRRRGGRGRGGAAAEGAPAAEKLDDDRYDRQEHDADQNQLDVGGDEGHLAEEVAQHGDAGAPQRPADDVVHHEDAVVHLAHPGDDRGEGAHDRHEPRQHDRARAVLLEEGVPLGDVLLLEPPGVGSPEQRRSDLASEQVADLVTGDRGERDQEADQPERVVEVAPVGDEQAGREQQRVAGQEEPDQQPGLGEDDDEDAEQAEGGDQLLRVQEVGAEGRQRSGRRHAMTSRDTPDRSWPAAGCPRGGPVGPGPPVT